VVVAALLALRAAAPLVSPPRPAGAEAGSSRAAAAAPSRPAELAETTGASLLLGGDVGLFRVDVDTRTLRPIPLPGRRFETDWGLIRRVGAVVVVHGGTAWVSAGRPGGAATRLGPASYALAATDPRRVWLVEETGDPERWFRVAEVKVDRSPTPPRPLARGTLPLSRRPVAAAPGGLLLDVVGPGSGLAVWDPRTGRLRHRFDTSSPVTVVAVSGGRVAWVEATTLHLGDLAGGRRRVIAAPAGSDGFAAAGAFSPDGRLLAAITEVGFASRPALALVRLDGGQAVRVEGSEGALADRCSACIAWAPTGDWVFFSRLGPGFGIGAYHLGRPRAVTVPVDLPFSFPPSFAVTRPE
jgi:hypothetical protein